MKIVQECGQRWWRYSSWFGYKNWKSSLFRIFPDGFAIGPIMIFWKWR